MKVHTAICIKIKTKLVNCPFRNVNENMKNTNFTFTAAVSKLDFP